MKGKEKQQGIQLNDIQWNILMPHIMIYYLTEALSPTDAKPSEEARSYASLTRNQLSFNDNAGVLEPVNEWLPKRSRR